MAASMFNTRFRGKNCAIAGQEYYLGKVRIRMFVPNCKLDFGSHLWDATVLALRGNRS